jgi:hypothetical protein
LTPGDPSRKWPHSLRSAPFRAFPPSSGRQAGVVFLTPGAAGTSASRRRGRSSAGRAPQSHCGGQGFKSPRLHQPTAKRLRFHVIRQFQRPGPFDVATSPVHIWGMPDVSKPRDFIRRGNVLIPETGRSRCSRRFRAATSRRKAFDLGTLPMQRVRRNLVAAKFETQFDDARARLNAAKPLMVVSRASAPEAARRYVQAKTGSALRISPRPTGPLFRGPATASRGGCSRRAKLRGGSILPAQVW